MPLAMPPLECGTVSCMIDWALALQQWGATAEARNAALGAYLRALDAKHP